MMQSLQTLSIHEREVKSPWGTCYNAAMPIGRPTLWKPEVRAKIIASIAEGNYNYVAAQAAGVSRSLLKQWMAKGRKEKAGEFKDFLAALKAAEGMAEKKAVAAIQKAGKKDPRWLCWFLERKYPQRWGRHTYQLKQLQAEFRKIQAEHKVLIEAAQRDRVATEHS